MKNMKTNTAKAPSGAPKHTPRKPARYAAHIGETGSWLDVAAPFLTEAERLHATYSAAPELLAALEIAEEYLSSPPFIALHGDTASRKARAAIAKAKGGVL